MPLRHSPSNLRVRSTFLVVRSMVLRYPNTKTSQILCSSGQVRLVKPVRLMLPKALAQSKIDWASLLTALLFALVFGLIWLLLFTVVSGGLGLDALEPAMFLTWLGLAFKLLLRVALQTLMILVIGFAILSWVQPGSPAYNLLGRLTEPLLAPLRRVVPSVGGIDLSAIVLILVLQIGLMVLA